MIRRSNPERFRCPHCKSVQLVKDGKLKRWRNDPGTQRWRCWNCGKVTIRPLPARTKNKQ